MVAAMYLLILVPPCASLDAPISSSLGLLYISLNILME